MTLKSAKPPRVFFDLAERMFQDVELFETLEDLLRFGLQGIPRDRLGDFTAFVKRVENHEIGDRDLERLWHGSGADVGYPAPGLRIFLVRRANLPSGRVRTDHSTRRDRNGPRRRHQRTCCSSRVGNAVGAAARDTIQSCRRAFWSLQPIQEMRTGWRNL